jgi:hypothetical protein
MTAQNLRLSDAERAEYADELGKHFADGRLDKTEYDERVSRVMSAKTRADMAGIFDDLPGGGPSSARTEQGWLPGAGASAAAGGIGARGRAAVCGRRRGGPLRFVMTAVLFIVALSIAGHIASHMLWWLLAPWWLVPLIFGFIAYRVLVGRSRTR